MRSVRQWFILFIAVSILPTVIVAALLIHQSYQRERASIEQSTLNTSRALMQAVDRELSSAESALQALSTSPSLASGDFASFQKQAVNALKHWPGGDIVLSDRNGRQLVNTSGPVDIPPGEYENPEQLQHTFETGRSAISNLYFSKSMHRPVVSIDVPVFIDDKVMYSLSLEFSLNHLAEILKRQQPLAGWPVAIFDGEGVIVARSLDANRYVGQKGVDPVISGIREMREGVVEATTLEDIPAIIVFSRSSMSGWAVATGIPKQVLAMDLWKSVSALIIGVLLLLSYKLLLARFVGNRITSSVQDLIKPAIALGYGNPVHLPPLYLREASALGQALLKVESLLKDRTRERDLATKAEQEIRMIQKQLEHSETLQRSIFEQAPDAILLVAASGAILRANSEAERIFGYPRERLLSMKVEDLIPREVRERHTGLRASFFATPVRRPMGSGMNLFGQRADNSRFPVDVMLSPLHSAEGEMVIATVRDVTVSKQREEAIHLALREKETLLKELYHRVKNNLQVISSLLNLQRYSLPEGTAREALSEGAARVHAMALVHEKLYQSGSLSSIELGEYITDLCTQLASAMGTEQRNIRVFTIVDRIQAGLDTAIPLGLLLNELVSNSIKHAFFDGRKGTVTVRLKKIPEDRIELSVRDDGIGFSVEEAITFPHSLGLKLVKALSAQLDGQLAFNTDEGTCATLVFKAGKPGQGNGRERVSATENTDKERAGAIFAGASS